MITAVGILCEFEMDATSGWMREGWLPSLHRAALRG